MSTATVEAREIEYPETDGIEMGESSIHLRAMLLLFQALEEFFRNRLDVFCASDMFWYWKDGDNTVRTAPDAMVVPGVGRHERKSFRSFHEGGAIPAVVFEILSDGTWEEDTIGKVTKYQKLGVPEYFLFDPMGTFMQPRLKGYRLRRGEYVPIRARKGRLPSSLGFELAPEDRMLRLFDAPTGKPVLTPLETAEFERRRVEELGFRMEELAEENARLQKLMKLRHKPNGNGS